MTKPPICDNCKRAAMRTARVALLQDGAVIRERDLCSACRVHVTDTFTQPAPWIGVYPERTSR